MAPWVADTAAIALSTRQSRRQGARTAVAAPTKPSRRRSRQQNRRRRSSQHRRRSQSKPPSDAAPVHSSRRPTLAATPRRRRRRSVGAWYTFERGVHKIEEGQVWADVWMEGHFGWEYKGKHRDLKAAYQQLLRYREDLGNPPLPVVCDLDRFEIHTNFTGTAKRVYAFDLSGLADRENLDVLRKLFTQPEALRPGLTTESITRQAAERFGLLADGMRVREIEPHAAAHFLMKLMFCMFAEDIGLLGKSCSPGCSKGRCENRRDSPTGCGRCSPPWRPAATSAPTRSCTSTAGCSPTRT